MAITKELRVVTGSYVDKNGEKKNTYMTIGTYGTGPYGEFVSIYRSFNPAGVPYKEGSNSIFATLVDPQKKMRKIKLCPLCGGEAELDRYGFLLYFVRCGDCNATGPAFEDKESAIKAWNKRYNWLGAFKKKLVRLIAQWIKEE